MSNLDKVTEGLFKGHYKLLYTQMSQL